jgi:hypothetical protein
MLDGMTGKAIMSVRNASILFYQTCNASILFYQTLV